MSNKLGVIIVGAGPVGAITGLRLAQMDIPVTIFEALEQTPTAHRAATTHSSTLDLLDEIGITGEILSQGLKARFFQYRYRKTNEIFAEFDFSLLKDETNHPYAVQLEQHKTVSIALSEASKLSNFKLYRGFSVKKLVNSYDKVKVLAESATGEEKSLSASYVIGCDGGRSTVRKLQGIDFPGFTWQERFLILASYFDYEQADRYRYRNYLADPDLWCSVFKIPGPSGSGMWRNLFPIHETNKEFDVNSDKHVYDMVASCFPYAESIKIIDRNIYNVHQRVASTFRKGKVLLAGDAAHINNPLGGMGMNSGIHDGLNIAEKIGKLWRGEIKDEESLLDLYDRQRRPLAQKYVQAQSIQNKEMLQTSDESKANEKFEMMRRTAEDPKRHKNFLLNASLINMLRESFSIE